MKVTIWLDGVAIIETTADLPILQVEDRITDERGTIYVVSERWSSKNAEYPGWHIVLRHSHAPSEETPPWKRNEES